MPGNATIYFVIPARNLVPSSLAVRRTLSLSKGAVEWKSTLKLELFRHMFDNTVGFDTLDELRASSQPTYFRLSIRFSAH